MLPFALQTLGLAGSYLAWLAFLVVGTIGCWAYGRNAWYFQLRSAGMSAEDAKREARAAGQELFPAGDRHGHRERGAGWVGGLGAFGGFVIPPIMAFAVRDLGQPGYSIGFIVFIVLALMSRALTSNVKYAKVAGAPRAREARVQAA